MTVPAEKRPSSARPRREIAAIAAPVAVMAVAAAATGAALHLGIGVAIELAIFAAVTTLAALITVFALVRRLGAVAALTAENEELRVEIEMLKSGVMRGSARAMPQGRPPMSLPMPPGATAPAYAPPPGMPQPVRPHLAGPPLPSRLTSQYSPGGTGPERRVAQAPLLSQPIMAAPQHPATTAPVQAHPAAHPALPGVPPAPTRPPATGNLPPSLPPPSGPLPLMTKSGQSISPPAVTDAAKDQPPAPPSVVAAPHAERRVASAPMTETWPQAAPASSTAPLDLVTMQTLIDQLAAKLNQPLLDEDQLAARPARATGDMASRPGAEAALRIDDASTPDAIARALQGDQVPLAPEPRAATPYGQLALVAEAVEANRMDVYLDPILGLADRKARHFELSVRLRTETGDVMEADDVVGLAAGTGLLARIDSAKLARAADVAVRLRSRGQRAALFSTIAGESLSDENFLGAFADILEAEEGIGSKLVLTFTQADARIFTPAHWQAIRSMGAIGLGFALEDVTDLDMDFSELKRHGFAFIKLDAAVFLEGLPAAGGHIPAADICRHLSGMGLSLIVGGIVAEKDLGRILGFGAVLGQGALFGGPRSVEIDRLRRAA